MSKKQGLGLVADKNTRILILGTMLGKKSNDAREYYSHKGNSFWKITIGEENLGLGYEEKKKLLLKKRIGLWDVYSEAEGKGSADKNIIKKKLNDFSILKKKCPNLELVCFNGRKAEEQKANFEELGYETAYLTSSSNNNPIKVSEKRRKWNKILRSKK